MVAEQNVLVISDLHLGESLRAEAGAARAGATDAALISFFDHHAEHRDEGRPWNLVINGDMVDFVAIRLMPDEAGVITGLDLDEHHYGLAEGPRAAVAKMRRVLHHHRPVFEAMARFVGAGNRLSIVIGNHDAAFHWPAVQELVRHALVAHWGATGASAGSARGVFDRIEFHPWFWFEPGLAWVEHGHQFDPYNAFEDVLAPATDEQALDESVGGALMHYIGNHYCQDMEALWGRGFFGYLEFWVGQGLEKGAGILGAYRDMVVRLIQLWRERRPERIAARRLRNRQRMERLARRARLPVEVLLRLRSLHTRPAVADLDDIVRAVMLDRLLLLVSIPAVVLALLVVQPPPILAALAAGLVWGPLSSLAARPRDPVNPTEAMRRVATVIRRVVRVPIVVFGHSHQPIAEPDGFYNTGSWVSHGDAPAFTHLRILRRGGKVETVLARWRAKTRSVLAIRLRPAR